jgi:probable HAF family extracellular repeat protein
MKSRVVARKLKTTLFAALLLAWPVLAQEESQPKQERFTHYKVVDLGTLGGSYSFALGLNNAGVVSGAAATALQTGDPNAPQPPQPPQTAFLWYRGHVINLGTLAPARLALSSEAGGPNASGEAALISETDKLDPSGEDFCFFGTHRQCLAAIWKNGKLSALSTFGGNNSQALGLNDLGFVVGFAETTELDPACSTLNPTQRYRFETAVWEPSGHIRALHPLPGDTVSFGFGINNWGQVVGASGLCSNTVFPENPTAPHAVLWERDGTPVDLGNLGGSSNIAGSINDRGDVNGTSSNAAGVVHSFLWTRESRKLRDLGTLHPDDIFTVAPCCNTINDRRQIVGFALDATFNLHAFIWQDGVIVDLNTLIPNNSPWYLEAAQSINESGQIAGWGTINGAVHGFLATPCGHDRDCDGK